MKAIIKNFRLGRHTQTDNQMVIYVDGIKSKEEAQKLVGKKVVWTAPGKNKKQLTGQITAAHGNSGAVRARFNTGMPGQSLGTEIKIE